MNNTYIYIDESGNIQNTNGFVICFVIFYDIDILDKVSLAIRNFKNKRFQNENMELHFNKESLTTKKTFFKYMSDQKFVIKYYTNSLRNLHVTYQEHLIASILQNIYTFQNARIFIDGDISNSKHPLLLQQIKTSLKRRSLKVKSIKFVNSKNNVLIQLADMCAGCIRRKLERNTADDRRLFDMIRKFIK